MYTLDEIQDQPALRKFAPLIGKRKYEEGVSVEVVCEELKKLQLDLYVEGAPSTVIKTTITYDDATDKAEYINIGIRPSNKYRIEGVDSNATFVLKIDASIYENYIKQYTRWVDNYIMNSKLVHNIKKLEADLKAIAVDNDIELPFDFKMGLGTDIIDITDSSITLGIKAEVAANLARLNLYDKIEIRRTAYIARITDFFKGVTDMLDFYRADVQLTKDLELRNRKSLYSMVRKTVSRRVEDVRTGIGYFDNGTTFAVVERIAIKESEVEGYTEQGYHITENTAPTKREKEFDRTKVASRYKLSPISKKEKEQAEEIELTSILA